MEPKEQKHLKGKGLRMAAPETDILLRISQATSRISSLEQLLKTSVKICGQSLRVDRCSIWLADNKKISATIKAVYARGRFRPIGLGATVQISKFPGFKRIISEGKVVHSPDISKLAANRFEKRFLAETKIKSFLCLPLKIKNRVLGALNFGTLRSRRTFTPAEIRLCRTIANQITIGIENARLHKKLEDGAVQLQEKSIKVLKESEQKYRTLLENLPQMIFLKNLRSVYISVNKNFCKSMGVKPEQIIGKTDFDFFPKELAQKYRKDDREIIRKGKTKEIVEDYIEKGKRKVVQTVKTPVLGDDGKPVGVLGIFWDVTEHKRMERALIQKEQIVRERARLLTDLRSLNEVDHILTRVCQAVRDSGLFQRAVMSINKPGGGIINLGQVGLSAAVIQRARKAPPLDPKLRARITSKRFRVSDSFFVPAEAGVDFRKTGRYIPQKTKESVDGDWQSGDELFVPLRDFSGKTMGYLSVDTPVDGRRPDKKTIQALEMLVEAAASRIREMEAQSVIKRERDFSQSVIETANNLIICLDHDARITAFNKECERITGYRRQEVLGKKWPELFLPPEYRHEKLESFANWVGAHPRDQYEGPIKTKKGEIRTILWSNTAVFGPGKKDLIAIAIGQDITERKKTEDALRDAKGKWVSLTENTNDVIMIVDSKGTLQFLNPTPLAINSKKAIGKTVYEYVPREQHDVLRESLRKVFKTGKSDSYEASPNIPEIGTMWFSTKVVPIKHDGKTVSVILIATDITERKQMEEELKKFKTISDRAGHGSAISDLKGNLIYINESFAQMHGYTPEELIRKNLSVFHNKEQMKDVKRLNKQLIETDSYVAEEVWHKRKNGTVFPTLMTATVIKDEKEKPLFMTGTAIDISVRKKAEEVMRENEKQLRILTDSLPVLISYVDSRQRYRFNNKGYEEWFGHSREEVFGKHLSTVLGRSAYRVIKGYVETALSGREVSFDMRVPYKDGGTRFVHASYVPDFGPKGKVKGFFALVNDITEQKKADEALKESQKFLNDVIDHIPDPLFIKNREHQWTLLNKAICEMLGYPREEMLGKSDYDFFPKKQADFFWKKDEEMFRTGKVVDIPEEPITDAQGNIHWLHTKKAPLKDPSDKISTLVGIIRDITDQKKAVEALRKSRDLNTILQISYKITQIHDLDRMLKLACEETAKALGVERCSVSLMDEEWKGGEVKAAYMKNQPRPEIIGSRFLLKDFPRLLRLYRRKEKFVYAPMVEKAPLSQRERDYFRAEGVKSFIIVPIAMGKRLLGAIMVGAMGKERVFAESEIAFVQTLANHLAVAVENIRLMELVKEQAENLRVLSQRVITAQEGERKRIAQELHDDISQNLALMKINMEMSKQDIPSELTRVIDRIKDNENLTAQTLEKVRNLTSDLRPPQLDDLGLVPTLRSYVKHFSKRTNIKVTLKDDRCRDRLPLDVEMVLYRIAQEALTNVAKHARAAEVSILLEKKNNYALLTVKDNGTGFDVKETAREQKQRKGFGLFDIEERVKLLNGSFSITSKPKKGTTLHIRIPCPRGR